jgi:hypothetical protein
MKKSMKFYGNLFVGIRFFVILRTREVFFKLQKLNEVLNMNFGNERIIIRNATTTSLEKSQICIGH